MTKVNLEILTDVYKETIVNNKVYLVVMEEVNTGRPVIYGTYATKESARKRKLNLEGQFLHEVDVQIIKATIKP